MLIFVYGTDSYSSTKKVEAMRVQFKNKFDPAGLNLLELPPQSGNKIEIGEVSQAITSPPFLGEKRLVIIKNLLVGLKKAEAEPWLSVLQKIPESSIVILWDKESEKTIEKNEIFKKLSGGDDVHCYPAPLLGDGELNKWAINFCKSINLTIAPGLLSKVVAMVGADLWQLSGELQKLKARSNGTAVSEQMVNELVRANVDDQIFAFIDAVAAKDRSRAMKMLSDERLAGAEDMYLFAMIARQVRLLLSARDVIDRQPRASAAIWAQELGVHPYVAQKTIAQAKSFSFEFLKKLHDLCFELDRQLKLGLDQGLAVDRLVSEFVAPNA
jgi:DNA polymerase-3 subunit delta